MKLRLAGGRCDRMAVNREQLVALDGALLDPNTRSESPCPPAPARVTSCVGGISILGACILDMQAGPAYACMTYLTHNKLMQYTVRVLHTVYMVLNTSVLRTDRVNMRLVNPYF